jgi:hypothetical protein
MWLYISAAEQISGPSTERKFPGANAQLFLALYQVSVANPLEVAGVRAGFQGAQTMAISYCIRPCITAWF